MTPARDRKYLNWVASQPCLYCQTTHGVVAHHEGKREAGGGTSLKGCDYHTLPLCHRCHGEYHQTARIGSWTRELTALRFARAIARLRQKWETLGGMFKPAERKARKRG